MAWVERYVRADADGAGDGTTDANSGATGSWTMAQAISGYAAGQRVNIKAGAYSVTAGLTFATAGTTTAPVLFRGYKTTIGDMDDAAHGTFMSGTEIPAWDLGSNRATTSLAFLNWQNIDGRSSQTTNGVFNVAGASCSLTRCRIEGTAASAGGRALNGAGTGISINRCWLKATTTATACVTFGPNGAIQFSRLVGGAIGITAGSAGTITVFGCVIDSPLNQGILSAGAVRYAIFNTVFYNTGSDGIRIAAEPTNANITTCIFSVIGGVGINNTLGTEIGGVTRNRNAFHSITSTQEDGFGDTEAIEPVTLSASPFVNAAAGDFNINDTAGGGADLRAETVVLP